MRSEKGHIAKMNFFCGSDKRVTEVVYLDSQLHIQFFQSLQAGLKELMEELAMLATTKTSFTDQDSGVSVQLDWLYGGDMKYLLLVYGAGGPTATYCCLFCLKQKLVFYEGDYKLNCEFNNI